MMELTYELLKHLFNEGYNALWYGSERYEDLSERTKVILKELKVSKEEWNERLL